MEQIEKSEPALNDTIKQILTGAVTTVNTSRLYTTPAFSGANDARSVLEYSLSDAASADRAVIEDRLSAGQPFERLPQIFLPTPALTAGMRQHSQSWKPFRADV